MGKYITILVGPPGSGKSTQAKSLINDNEDLVYINQDSQGKKGHLDNFNAAIADGKSIVVDRMNHTKGQRSRYLDPAIKYGYDTVIIVLHVAMEVCLNRCIARENHETIKDEETANKAVDFFFRNYERVEDNEADSVFREGWVADGEKIIVSDLDGTLCNVEHRRHHVRPPVEETDLLGKLDAVEITTERKKYRKNWKAFFEEMVDDTPNQWCVDLLTSMRHHGYNFVYATGRGAEWRDLTEDWLRKHGMDFDVGLYTRMAKDSRKDSIVKEIILEFEIKTRYDILMVIDDRKQVVEMWRKHGYTVLQCDEGDF